MGRGEFSLGHAPGVQGGAVSLGQPPGRQGLEWQVDAGPVPTAPSLWGLRSLGLTEPQFPSVRTAPPGCWTKDRDALPGRPRVWVSREVVMAPSVQPRGGHGGPLGGKALPGSLHTPLRRSHRPWARSTTRRGHGLAAGQDGSQLYLRGHLAPAQACPAHQGRAPRSLRNPHGSPTQPPPAHGQPRHPGPGSGTRAPGVRREFHRKSRPVRRWA